MCGAGGVTGRPRDPGGGAASSPAQIPRERGPRPRAPAPSPVCSRVRAFAERREAAELSAARSAVSGGAGRMQSRRWRAEEGAPGRYRAVRGAGLGPRKRGRVGDPEEPGGAGEVGGSRFFLRGFFQNQSLRSGENLSAPGVARSSRRGGQCRRQKLLCG